LIRMMNTAAELAYSIDFWPREFVKIGY
jgi:hypothetical protein